MAFARPTFGVNHVLAYGQSLSSGWEGWPALSHIPQPGCLMLGESVHPAHEHAPHWQPIGAAMFRPLAATVQGDAMTLLSPAEVAALPPGNTARGETILEAALNTWRARMRADGAADAVLLGSSCGVGGRNIEALSRHAEPDLFNRLRDCATLGRQVAHAHGRSYGIVALLFLQGEFNAIGHEGCVSDRAGYRALAERLFDDMRSEIAGRIAGQALMPCVFTYQTGGTYAGEDNAVAQAQLETALSYPGCTLVAPSYPMPEKGGHLDANGYRWLGVQFGRALHRVLTLGQRWRPLHPLGAEAHGRRVLVAFHVPVPPLAWGLPFMGQTRVPIDDRGFTVLDAAGAVPIETVEIETATTLRIGLGRDLIGPAILRYADRAHHGRGCLHDSDADVAEYRYEYDPKAGHYPSADQPDLNGKPYPLMNWCVAFAIPVAMVPG